MVRRSVGGGVVKDVRAPRAGTDPISTPLVVYLILYPAFATVLVDGPTVTGYSVPLAVLWGGFFSIGRLCNPDSPWRRPALGAAVAAMAVILAVVGEGFAR